MSLFPPFGTFDPFTDGEYILVIEHILETDLLF